MKEEIGTIWYVINFTFLQQKRKRLVQTEKSGREKRWGSKYHFNDVVIYSR